ncbi:MAG TPA: AmmeMemoRadiSam system protein A [Candidatus Polarisedimenticolia bacterium]|jgi:AmmeMemoRadiSam system protein A|nr:AmmeMemoRadiSam system protein A [Candidatus Polarisedimenticolia bacterium]
MSPLQDPSPARLAAAERLMLTALVRRSVETFVRQGRQPALPERTPLFSRRCGAFVSLFIDGKLRGCIGVVEPAETLDRTLVHCAIAAASEDRRFPPVIAEELPGLRCEISLLSPLFPVATPEEIEIGRHGVLIRAGRRHGLLLPQVPVGRGWDRETLLRQVCRKAGLPADAWRDLAESLFIFTAEIVDERRA